VYLLTAVLLLQPDVCEAVGEQDTSAEAVAEAFAEANGDGSAAATAAAQVLASRCTCAGMAGRAAATTKFVGSVLVLAEQSGFSARLTTNVYPLLAACRGW
jgi:hypothetical protein